MDKKYMSAKEFQEKGYLQELNRQFLHPLGLALEVYYDDEGNCYISGVWDYRDDPEGIYYNLENSDKERIERFQKNFEFIQNEKEKRRKTREELFDDTIEPIPDNKE